MFIPSIELTFLAINQRIQDSQDCFSMNVEVRTFMTGLSDEHEEDIRLVNHAQYK